MDFPSQDQTNDGIFLDRDAKTFQHVLSYLRSDQKFLPSDISTDDKKLIETELKHWKITSLNYEHATSQHLLNMEKILNVKPEMYGSSPQGAQTKWQQLGPLSVSEIIIKSGVNPCMFDEHDIEIKIVDYENHYVCGMFKKGSNCKHGIVRAVHKSGGISEFLALNDRFMGYGRQIFPTGDFYLGKVHGTFRHGQGRYVFQDGKIKDGTWQRGQFKARK